MSSRAPRGSSPGGGALFAAIGVFVLIGVPLVYVVWEALNHLLTGNVGAVRPGPVLTAVIGLVVVLHVLTSVQRRWSDAA